MNADHSVTVKACSDTDGTELTPDVKFECRGDRSSDCHRYPDCDCEAWEDDHPHPKVVHNECWMQGWFEGDCHDYDGDDRNDLNGDWGIPAGMNRSGPISADFQMEYISWTFAEASA